MAKKGVLLLEDSAVDRLWPVTLLRPAYDIGCAGWTLRQAVVEQLGMPVAACVRPRFNDLACQQDLAFQQSAPSQPTLIVNARMVPSIRATATLRRMTEHSSSCVARSGDDWAALWLPSPHAGGSMIDWISDLSSAGGLEAILARIPGGVTEESNDLSLFHWPYDIVRHHKTHFGETLLAISRGLGADESYQQLGEKIVAAKDAIIGKHAVLDTSRGPIVLMKGAEIGPLSFLRGPVMIGPDARVNDHASVKDGVMLGQTARVGGELHNSIVEPFSNKQHHGFLGDSYVGAWVNLGAGTTNSNLKNTYGTIRVTYHAKETGAHKFNLPNDEYVETKVDTGMQFLGVVIGD